jgi:hypothetical protein
MTIKGAVYNMGLTFFCNSMVEESYYLVKNKNISDKLKLNCKQMIKEIKDFKTPLNKLYNIPIDEQLFGSSEFLQTLEEFSKELEKSVTETLIQLEPELKNIISKKPINEKINSAKKIQSFFDSLGDHSYYATRDCIRN